MQIFLLKAIVVCPLVFIAGFVDAVAGGGGLISLPAYLIAGVPVHTAIGTNKISSCMGTGMATARYAKSGFIDPIQAFSCAIFALLGSALGANLALNVDNTAFKYAMLVILPLSAFYTLRTRSFHKKLLQPKRSIKKVLPMHYVISFFIGIYDGFYGPGTGTFLILLFTGLSQMAADKANGLTKAINLTTNVAAICVYLFSGNVYLPLGLTAGLFSVVGNYLGTKYFKNSNVKGLKIVIIAVITLFFVKVLGELFGII